MCGRSQVDVDLRWTEWGQRSQRVFCKGGAMGYGGGAMTNSGFPEWLDKTEASSVGVLTLEDGQRIKGEILGFDEDSGDVTVEVRAPGGPKRRGRGKRQVIAAERVGGFEPLAREGEGWPYTDPCLVKGFDPARFALMTMVFLGSTIGGIVAVANRPYAVQLGSAIAYTF